MPQPATTPPPGATPAGADTKAPPTFADVVKNAEAMSGIFTLYKKDDRTLLEVRPDQLEKLYLVVPTIESAPGERGFYAPFPQFQLLPVALRRDGPNVHLVQKNLKYGAVPGDPAAAALAPSYSDSILATAKVESAPHPERKSLLIDASKLFAADLLLLGGALELEYRLPYKLDAGSSALHAVRVFPSNLELESNLNFTVERLPLPPPPGGPPPAPTPVPPIAPPDFRSLTFRIHYSLASPPETADFRPRAADDRIGHWEAMAVTLGDDKPRSPYSRTIWRWPLQKADPSAPLSPPRKPIVMWLDTSVPPVYRRAVTEGILLWNRAFEQVGFKNAIVVKERPPDADWDLGDSRYNTVRWFTGTGSGFAFAASQAHPLTGEYFKADILLSEVMIRAIRLGLREFGAVVSPPAGLLRRGQTCGVGEGLASHSAFGFSALKARGALRTTAQEDEFIRQFLIALMAHEMGHALGLRHNFRASQGYPLDKLNDTAFTSTHGLSASVMDYLNMNLAPKRARQGHYFTLAIGPYDELAIEYAYREIPEGEEQKTLAAIAARTSSSPELAYASDEDVTYPSDPPYGIDPRAEQWDMSDDALRFFRERAAQVRELWHHLESAQPPPGEDYHGLLREYRQGLDELGGFKWFTGVLPNVVRYVGGLYHNRDHAADPGGQRPYVPVPAAKQREAFAMLQTEAFGRRSFMLSANVLNKLGIEQDETYEDIDYSEHKKRLDFPLHDEVLKLQRELLDLLLHPVRLARLQDLELRVEDRDRFTMADLFRGLTTSIWAELKDPSPEVQSLRRALQREHLKRLVHLLLKPDPGTPDDASMLARWELKELKAELQRAQTRAPRATIGTRAHLSESLARVDEALKAPLTRTAE